MRSKSYLYAVVFLSGLLCVVLKASAQNVQIYSQECPAFFEGDSLYLRYGTKYAIKDIPEAYFLFVEHALGKAGLARQHIGGHVGKRTKRQCAAHGPAQHDSNK